MSNQESPGGVSRRALLKSTALGSLALAAGGLTLPFTLRRAAAAVQQATGDTTRIVWGACSVNCGSRCALRLHVRDDEVVYVETDNTGDDRYGDHQVRACLRGRSIRRRINHPDRLNYPMKRVGKRGEGKFVRISWQEALDTLADRLKSVVAQYGNEAVYINYSSGIVGGNITRSSPSASPVARLMNCYGGSLNQYGTYSTAQIACAMPYTYGSNDGNSTSDIENSKLVVMFGNNPAETRMSGGGITWYLEQARERSNARMIVIDPRYTDTAAGREDEWIPIRPGTDAALVAGIAWVLINEDLVDQPFLDKYCVGYDEKTLPAGAPANGHYKAYILGEGDDGIAKTPQWASRITGIPTDRIIKLAREIGMSKPAYICQGWGPQRQANGELTARAIAMLPILTGNVGINGGNSGARESTYTITIERLPVLENPVKTAISCFTWTDAIARGPEMTASRDGVRGKEKLDVPIKFLWNYYSHRGFVKLKLAPPWQLALGGLIVGGLSLITPAVWGNGYSVVQSYLLLPPSGALLVGVFICKLLAVLASSGSGAPGGVFTPTLFVGLAMGMLFACVSRLWLPGSEEMAIMMGLTGMAAFLAATTHAPIMSTLMICEMTGQYTLLPGLLITCVVSSVLSRTLRRDSIYRHHVAEHV
ncbi:anaerobic dimethyl sulfoxide reductase subunit A [Klebsiella pneumoniae]|nr:anaerobic dimethyl sulfoxide reductase subunit A [Klebsiella pneumoniae]SYL52790.1 anaerobic dimethyl sulfoxide reductase subunit A [Klebsiella pneumoniae]VUG72219.1 anaerobic dimethyl sulfoxide reductase subunit A [Klebsiella pneumoniae]